MRLRRLIADAVRGVAGAAQRAGERVAERVDPPPAEARPAPKTIAPPAPKSPTISPDLTRWALRVLSSTPGVDVGTYDVYGPLEGALVTKAARVEPGGYEVEVVAARRPKPRGPHVLTVRSLRRPPPGAVIRSP